MTGEEAYEMLLEAKVNSASNGADRLAALRSSGATSGAERIAAMRGSEMPRTRPMIYLLYGDGSLYTNLPRGRSITESDHTSGVIIDGGTIENVPEGQDK